MVIHAHNPSWPLDQGLIDIINKHLQEQPPSPGIGCILSFRDPTYCPERVVIIRWRLP